MTYTEEEAKTKWCPHSRVQVERKGYTPSPMGSVAGDNYALAGVNRLLEAGVRNALCLASGCMMWREDKRFGEPGKHPGFCGLAGQPNVRP